MSEYPSPLPTRTSTRTILIHVTLFVLTFVTTTLAGVQWLNKDATELMNFPDGLTYSFLLLFVLGVHEFGHYFAARYHGVSATLPFFLPFPSILQLWFFNPFGTLGAVIRLKSPIPSRRVLFDIGATGPLAGFLASSIILVLGFANLPGKEYLYSIHPEYALMETIPEGGWVFGRSIFYSLGAALFAPSGVFVPPMNEIYHYPFLCVGWFGLLVTAINLIPVGQLDGGHVSYAMFGTGSHRIAQIALVALAVMGVAGLLPAIGVDPGFGYAGWLFWAIVLIFFMRVLKLNRPALVDETPLDPVRRALGWTCFIIFVGSFSLTPITLNIP